MCPWSLSALFLYYTVLHSAIGVQRHPVFILALVLKMNPLQRLV